GFVLGTVRFVYEVLDKTSHYTTPLLRKLVDMNFLHYAVLMFVVCTVVLIGVSMMYPAPARKKIAGLSFATVDDKLESMDVRTANLKRETHKEHMLNVVFTAVLIVTVFGLWIYFR
ncbi:MAG TPA: hypothetical protein VHS08_01110, partial [Candidatus Acidoferrales bacterium]|nr:hypothetical protein [Candidatus Acidoferrales bacterium]